MAARSLATAATTCRVVPARLATSSLAMASKYALGIVDAPARCTRPVALDQSRHVEAHAGDAVEDGRRPGLALPAHNGALALGEIRHRLPLTLCSYGRQHVGGVVLGGRPLPAPERCARGRPGGNRPLAAH
jgi:hypothetical protein